MRIEICGYVAAKLHGWKKADQAICEPVVGGTEHSLRLPASHEYLARDARHPFFGYHRVFAWKAFILQALEMAGLREPAADPRLSFFLPVMLYPSVVLITVTACDGGAGPCVPFPCNHRVPHREAV